MSLQQGKSERRILPRWQASTKAAQTGGFASLKAPPKVTVISGQQFDSVQESFLASPDVGTAAEMLAIALLEGKEATAKSAAAFIEEHAAKAPATLLRFARSAIHQGDEQALAVTKTQVRSARSLLRLNPDNPLIWSDMARHYASLGHKERANRCMRIALQLAPDHSWMLRTASRFFVHQQDADGAHALLANHPRTRQDPWLIAAELACAQVCGRTPKYWKQANEILRFDKFAPRHISELATAVAMMELEGAGGRKRARKLVVRGLLAPTENTLAQIFWAKQQKHLGNGFGLDELLRDANDAYEADFRRALAEGDLLAALRAARTWCVDEPFAARPKAEVAYIASLLDDHDLTAEMERAVIRIDGEADPTLRMNALFSKLSSGILTIEKNREELLRIRGSLVNAIEQKKDEAYHAIANLGLWHYRYGAIEDGWDLYQKAIAIAEKRFSLEAATQAAVFAAREAILSRDSRAPKILVQAKDLAKRSKNKACEFYLRKIDVLATSPDQANQILSPSSAERFLTVAAPEQEMTPAFHVKREGGRLVVIVPNARKADRS